MEDKIKLIDKNGNVIEYDILYRFIKKEDQKHYIVYTDFKFDAHGRYNIFALNYDSNSNDIKFNYINSEEEMEKIKLIVNYGLNKQKGGI